MIDEQQLIDYVTQQRWFGSKARVVVHAHVIESAVLREADPRYLISLVEIAFDTGVHETYQLPQREDDLDGLADHAVEVDQDAPAQ